MRNKTLERAKKLVVVLLAASLSAGTPVLTLGADIDQVSVSGTENDPEYTADVSSIDRNNESSSSDGISVENDSVDADAHNENEASATNPDDEIVAENQQVVVEETDLIQSESLSQSANGIITDDEENKSDSESVQDNSEESEAESEDDLQGEEPQNELMESVTVEIINIDEYGNVTTETDVIRKPVEEELVGSAQSTVTSRAAFVKAIRANLVAHKENFEIPYELPAGDYNGSYFSNIYNEARSAHTGKSAEGDYLDKCSLSGCTIICGTSGKGVMRITQYYNATAEQERYATETLNDAVEGLGLFGRTEFQKVLRIHDYICGKVNYDEKRATDDSDELQHTAYAALIRNRADSRGYAGLFYRLTLESGMDCRIVSGSGPNGIRYWNIVRIGDMYYNIDVTLDGLQGNKKCFLVSDDEFDNHKLNDMYKTAEFTGRYPMYSSSYDYSPEACISIDKASVRTKSASYVYNGCEKKPEPVVTLGGKTLVKNRDYTVSYFNNKNVGTATVNITGIGNYRGIAKTTFKITRKSLTGAIVKTVSTGYVYSGSAKCPKPIVISGNTTLKLDRDYKVTYTNNKNVGTATVTVTGIGSYSGTAKCTFKITRCSLANATVNTKSSSYKYNGKAKCPTPTVKIGNKTLVSGTDYTVAYKNNIKVGTATVIVTGKGNYTGTASAKFKIVKADGYIDVSSEYTQLNNYRKSKGKNVLKRNAALENTAKIRAKEIVTLYSHQRPDNTSCYTAFPSGLTARGENIVSQRNSVEEAMDAWKNSPGHNKNMLSENYNAVGLACYQVNGVKYWVQCFGRVS